MQRLLQRGAAARRVLAAADLSALGALEGVREGLAAWAPRRAFSAGDSHDDFKPRAVGAAAAGGPVAAQIEAAVAAHTVFVFMKGHPGAPQCGFSNAVCRILDAHGAAYGSADVLADPALREGIKAFTAWPTIPQVFIAGEFVGGSDILMQMHQSGELGDALAKAGAGGAK